MANITKTEVVPLKEMTEPERLALASKLYRLHSQIFDGVSLPDFTNVVLSDKAQYSWILLFQNREGEPVGYMSLHIYEKQLRGQTCAIFRATAGMLRQYRGGGSTLRFAVQKALEYKARHPNHPMYYFAFLIHPSSYTLFARYAQEVWPRMQEPTPPDIVEFLSELGDVFQLGAPDPKNPLVRHVGWRTRDTTAEQEYWQNTQRPEARFFLQSNPKYHAGYGLSFLMPLNSNVVLGGFGRYLYARGEQQLTSLKGRLLSRFLSDLDATQKLQTLKQASTFDKLPASELNLLAEIAKTTTINSREYLFYSGDAGDSLYVIVKGAAYVTVQRWGEEVVLDELGPGDILGEMALLTGERRTASIRAIGMLVLLKIERQPFLKMMENHPDLKRALYQSFAQRQLYNYLLAFERFSHFTEAMCREWLSQGKIFELSPEQKESTRHDAFVFVLTGSVEVQGDDEWLALQGPSLAHVGYKAELQSKKGAFVIELPPPPKP